MDLPLYTTVQRSELSDLGSADYHLFQQAIVLNRVMRQVGSDVKQKLFRAIQLRMRNAETTLDDWNQLMIRTVAEVGDIASFEGALWLYSTAEAVAEHNFCKLQENRQPVALLRAVHTGMGTNKVAPDEAGGLEATILIAEGARVMLTANLWVEVGLVNGALGIIKAICYGSDQSPPDLPIAVTVKFDPYTGPTLHDGTVPIIPIQRSWFSSGSKLCSRLQIPLKLAWAITIHKFQGLTLNKAVIDIGKKEFSAGLPFVACSRVQELDDFLFVPPFSFKRMASLGNISRLKERLAEDKRLILLSSASFYPKSDPDALGPLFSAD